MRNGCAMLAGYLNGSIRRSVVDNNDAIGRIADGIDHMANRLLLIQSRYDDVAANEIGRSCDTKVLGLLRGESRHFHEQDRRFHEGGTPNKTPPRKRTSPTPGPRSSRILLRVA